MYATCLFCNKPLGANEALETFPVGKRLAFDAAKGRLWVVCPHCERWNLSPLEERWEAIESAERQFRDTRRRVSTDNIGLAKLRDGTTLVRIGQPLRPEFAAWRYGDQFGRRRRQALALSGITVVTAAALYGLGPLLGVAIGGIAMAGNLASMAYAASQQRRVIARISVASRQRPIEIRGQLVRQIKIDAHGDDWALIVPFEKPRNRLIQWATSLSTPDPKIVDHEVLTGDFALRTAAKVLPAMNWGGGRKEDRKSVV